MILRTSCSVTRINIKCDWD